MIQPKLSETKEYVFVPTKREPDEIEVHKECGGIVHSIGPDGISYCEDCEVICEGETEHITEEEWENRNK